MAMRQRHLAAFIALAETGSFKKAAAQLHQSPAALSVSIKDLETSAGVQLFERTTRKVVLTEAGVSFVPAARRAWIANHEAESSLAQIATGQGGRLRLAVAPSVALAWLPGALSQFIRQHPRVEVTVTEGTASHVSDAITAGYADLGIQGASGVSPDLVSEVIYRDPIVRVGRGGIRIGLTEGTHTEQLLARAGIEPPRIQVDTPQLAVRLAQSLGGHALLPSLTLGALESEPMPHIAPRDICRLTRTSEHDNPVIRAFMRELLVTIQSFDGATKPSGLA